LHVTTDFVDQAK